MLEVLLEFGARPFEPVPNSLAVAAPIVAFELLLLQEIFTWQKSDPAVKPSAKRQWTASSLTSLNKVFRFLRKQVSRFCLGDQLFHLVCIRLLWHEAVSTRSGTACCEWTYQGLLPAARASASNPYISPA